MTSNAELVADSTAYVAQVRVRRVGGPDKMVSLPGETDEVKIGSHPDLAPHIGADPTVAPSASSLDYVIGAAAACLAGTFARTLAARGVTVPLEDHHVEAEGIMRPHRQ